MGLDDVADYPLEGIRVGERHIDTALDLLVNGDDGDVVPLCFINDVFDDYLVIYEVGHYDDSCEFLVWYELVDRALALVVGVVVLVEVGAGVEYEQSVSACNSVLIERFYEIEAVLVLNG